MKTLKRWMLRTLRILPNLRSQFGIPLIEIEWAFFDGNESELSLVTWHPWWIHPGGPMFTPTMQLSVHVKEVGSMTNAWFWGSGWIWRMQFEMCQVDVHLIVPV